MTAAITIHFRKPELTAGCIDTLLADGWAPVLVWDNSADEGRSLQALVARYAGEPRVHLVGNPTNLGFGKGMNAALVELGRRGHVGPVLLVNNDAQVLPGMRAALLAALPRDSAIPVLVAPRILQDGQAQGWLYYHRWLALVTRRPVPGGIAYLSGCCLLVRRPDNAAPLFDDDFFMYGEDVELSWRWRRQGGALVLLEDIWLHHAGSASTGQASVAYERFLVGSHWTLACKLADGPLQATVMRLLRVPSLSLRAVLRSLRYRSWVPLRSLGQLFMRSSIRPTNQEARR
ncbi:MAG: glycosyltransferase family 2 protein [Xanthomonadaceae bacterium]|nr:glycosyltransferase family 2 protein [Xanthomonadaceae bacterium]